MTVPLGCCVNSYVVSARGPTQKIGWFAVFARLVRSAWEAAVALDEVDEELPLSRSASQRIRPTATARTMTAPARKRCERTRVVQSVLFAFFTVWPSTTRSE